MSRIENPTCRDCRCLVWIDWSERDWTQGRDRCDWCHHNWQTAEIARLNAKIKRRDLDLRRRYGSAPSIVHTPYETAIRAAKQLVRTAKLRREYRMARRVWGVDKAKAAWLDARALRLSDPTFAGRLP